MKMPKDFKLSLPYKCGSYIRQDISAGNLGIGHISYKIKNNILIIDSIRISSSKHQHKGYAGSALASIIKKNKVQTITSSEDGFSSQGRRLVTNFAIANNLRMK